MKICEICNVLDEDVDVIFETKYWRAALDGNDQYYPGKSFVILKRHSASLSDLTEGELTDFLNVVRRLETAIKKSLGSTLFNWSCLMNLAYQSKPYNPHIHWHVRPRYDSTKEIGGESFTDKEFGLHYKMGEKRKVSDKTKNDIIHSIKGAL